MCSDEKTVVQAMKDLKVSTFSKIAWGFWRLLVLVMLVTAALTFIYFTIGDDSIFLYWDNNITGRDIGHILAWLLSLGTMYVSWKELASGTLSKMIIIFLTHKPNTASKK